MLNLVKSLAIAVVAYILGWLVASSWVAGFLPALLFGGGAYVWFARASMKKLEVIALQAGQAAQAGNVAAARQQLEAALALGKEQFLVAEQVHGQLGMLDYMEAMQPCVEAVAMGKRPPALTVIGAKLGLAREHFEKSWSRDWRSKALLAIIQHREGKAADANATMEKTATHAEKEPIFWAVWAWLLNEAKDREAALKVIGRGLTGSPGNAHLTAIQEALSNQKRPDFTVFGDAWIQFFPDQVSREQLFEMAKAAGKVPAGAQMAPVGGQTKPANQTFRPVGPTPPPPRGGRMPRG